jgi:hypothetical protein
MDEAERLAIVKTRLGIVVTDMSQDAALQSYIDEAADKVRNYCNRKNIPAGLDYAVIGIAVDLYNLKSPSGRLVVEERQGNRELKYAGAADADKVVGGYAAELNRYRRTKVV